MDKTPDTRRAVTAWLPRSLGDSVSAPLTFSFIVFSKASELSIPTSAAHCGQKSLTPSYTTLEGQATGKQAADQKLLCPSLNKGGRKD